jgi:hypothetical protein
LDCCGSDGRRGCSWSRFVGAHPQLLVQPRSNSICESDPLRHCRIVFF